MLQKQINELHVSGEGNGIYLMEDGRGKNTEVH